MIRVLLECDPSTVSVQDDVSWSELILLWMWSACLVGRVVSFISHIWSYLFFFSFLPRNSLVSFPSTMLQGMVTWKWFVPCWSVILPFLPLRTRYVDLSWYCFEYDDLSVLSVLLYRLFLISDHITLFFVSSSFSSYQDGRLPIHYAVNHGKKFSSFRRWSVHFLRLCL